MTDKGQEANTSAEAQTSNDDDIIFLGERKVPLPFGGREHDGIVYFPAKFDHGRLDMDRADNVASRSRWLAEETSWLFWPPSHLESCCQRDSERQR